jgi:hypothetical protein
VGPARLTAGEVVVKTTLGEVVEPTEGEHAPLPPGARLIFGYDPATGTGYEVGIGATISAYIVVTLLSAEAGTPSVVAIKGEPGSLVYGKEYELRVRFSGTQVSLVVDGTAVLDAALPQAPIGSQLGLRAYGGQTLLSETSAIKGKSRESSL